MLKRILFCSIVMFFATSIFATDFIKEKEQTCNDLAASIGKMSADIKNSEEALFQLEEVYFEVCFSHGGAGSFQCSSMFKLIADQKAGIAEMKKEVASLEETFKKTCQ